MSRDGLTDAELLGCRIETTLRNLDDARTAGDQEWVAAEEAILGSLQRSQADEGWAR